MDLITAIGSLGFPIIAFVMMYQLSNKTIKENTNAIIELKNSIILSSIKKN